MSASVETAWVKPPYETGGLDHLGVQAPCIQIYGQLLPGITNVTDRARYYSFYLWLFYEFDNRAWREKNEVVAYLRKADCLFSLIAIRHGQLHGNLSDHAGAAVGSNTLSPVVASLATQRSIRLSDYTHFNDNDSSRYFKNPLGGLGQYYFGVLQELKLMSGDSSVGARLIKETGARIAKAVALGVNADAFMQVLESDEVTLAALDELSGFCHCQLAKADQEVSLLIDLMREGWPAIASTPNSDDSVEEKAASRARSKSLAILIQLSGICAEKASSLDVYCFRGLTYSQCDFEQNPLHLSEPLLSVAGFWQVYQRNELLAVAMQGLFFSLLRAADLDIASVKQRFSNTRELCQWFWQAGPGSVLIANQGVATLDELLNARCAALPAFSDWKNTAHEIQLMERIVKHTEQKALGSAELVEITDFCLEVLAAVCCRPENQSAYGDVQFRVGYFEPYPVNLDSVPKAIHESLSTYSLEDALIRFSAHYCLDSHLSVAMRKLRQQGQNTSRFEVTENGLVIKDIPPATHTSPRFYQSMRILRDLGLLAVRDDIVHPSASGLAFLKAVS